MDRSDSTPQPWHPLNWMGVMWVALFGLVFLATRGLAPVVVYLAI